MGSVMVKRVLMIAFHFPPLRGSSGIQRTLKFSKYLPEYGWEPILLTAHPRAYSSTSNDLVGEIADLASVHRAFALDTSRHLSVLGHYPNILALPDRWISWWLGAIPMGLSLIKKYRPDVIWSTYPIATAHLIGLSLCRLTGTPWVADLRDPMTDVNYPPNLLTRRIYQWIEKKTITCCTRAVCTTPGAVSAYRAKFPKVQSARLCLIENGYDEENFVTAELGISRKWTLNKPFVLVHSGIIYPSERDPTQFFAALSVLIQQRKISKESLNIILRATAHDEYLQRLIDQYGLGEIVSLAPPIPYQEALSEMLTADGLLLLQASNCNYQIPAKLYEYLRTYRPILALTDLTGDTAATLLKVGINTIAPLDSIPDIVHGLLNFLELVKNGEAPIALMEEVSATSRKSRTKELANLLDQVAQESG